MQQDSASHIHLGFGFYHYLVDGSNLEIKQRSTQREKQRLGATFIEGSIKLYVDGEIRYEGAGSQRIQL